MSYTPTSKPPRLVVCAAIKMDDGRIIVGIRHFSPDMRSTMEAIYGPEYHRLGGKHQGFVDQWGVYMDREEAWQVATEANQIRFEVSCAGTLYSENLY